MSIQEQLCLTLLNKFGLKLYNNVNINELTIKLNKYNKKQVLSKVSQIISLKTNKISFKKLFSNTFLTKINNEKQKKRKFNETNEENLNEMNQIEVNESIEMNELNENKSNTTLPLMLEIGSGSGDWIIQQAKESQNQFNWISMELRNDRIYNILTKSYYNNLSNLCYIGGDANHIISNYYSINTIDSIFINFPEPPMRLNGINDSQGKHLLTIEFFHNLYNILKSNGTITIVSDNLLYIKSICLQLSQLKHKLFYSKNTKNIDSNRILEETYEFNHNNENENNESENNESNNRIELWRGNPDMDVGHIVSSSSYFDRLWDNGQKSKRWLVYLMKTTQQ